jgi:hypothetical protein
MVRFVRNVEKPSRFAKMKMFLRIRCNIMYEEKWTKRRKPDKPHWMSLVLKRSRFAL